MFRKLEPSLKEEVIEKIELFTTDAEHSQLKAHKLKGKLKNFKSAETIIDEISIKDDNDQYTPAFINLLKEYYLHL